jgi:hypothetical protein
MSGRFIVMSSDPAAPKHTPPGEVNYCETAAKAIVRANGRRGTSASSNSGSERPLPRAEQLRSAIRRSNLVSDRSRLKLGEW